MKTKNKWEMPVVGGYARHLEIVSAMNVYFGRHAKIETIVQGGETKTVLLCSERGLLKYLQWEAGFDALDMSYIVQFWKKLKQQAGVNIL